MAARVFGAVDIGASGGRVMAGVVAPPSGRITLHTLHRFANGAAMRGGHLRWDLTGIFAEVITGLTALAAQFPEVESIGIDTWAVDYGLIDADDRLLAEPISYRDQRTADAVDRVNRVVSREKLFEVNGLQHLPFTTLYQLEADQADPLWQRAGRVVLLPDLLAYWLTGSLASEATNASTTGLVDVRTGAWSTELMTTLGLRPELFPPLEHPGTERGRITAQVAARTGLRPRVVVTTVGSHDTASAVVGVPATTERFAYVSCGTWSLVGLELETPVLTDAARDANFTNEGGVDGTTRFLRNVGGLWLLQESLRQWRGEGMVVAEGDLLAAAEALPAGGPLVDVDDEAFIPPGDMPRRIADAVVASGGKPPTTPAATVRCILDSLATTYAATVRQAAALANREVDVVHVVGGGSRNSLLCQLTADLTGRRVVAGPIEGTALGNVLVQARARGAAPRRLKDLRAMLADSVGPELRVHQPRR